MRLIKASLTAHVRPTTMILGEDNRKRWSDLDVLIMQAYQILEDERCGQCGLPRWICHNEDPKLQVRVLEDYCFVRAEIEQRDEDTKEKPKGTVLYPEMYHRDNLPLHKLRESYYEQRAAEAAQAVEEQD